MLDRTGPLMPNLSGTPYTLLESDLSYVSFFNTPKRLIKLVARSSHVGQPFDMWLYVLLKNFYQKEPKTKKTKK
jgi:hypothetical protein